MEENYICVILIIGFIALLGVLVQRLFDIRVPAQRSSFQWALNSDLINLKFWDFVKLGQVHFDSINLMHTVC